MYDAELSAVVNALASEPVSMKPRPVGAPSNQRWGVDLFCCTTSRPLMVLDSGSDDELLGRVAREDRIAFGALYDRLATPLYSLALKILANESEAKDILQDVFIAIWIKAPTFRADRGSAFSWTASLLRNRAIDRIRSRRRRGELIEANAPDLEPTGSATLFPSESAAISERGRVVRLALDQIPVKQRQVLHLVYFEGLTWGELAVKLDEPIGTVKARAQRGMANLRRLLKGLHE